jgi:hypothetical protein
MRVTKLSDSKELEHLQNRRAELEEESNSLGQQQQNLEIKVKTLEERIRISELENTNKTRLEAITQLESKMGELEQRLKAVEKPGSYESTNEAKLEINEVPESAEEVTTSASETNEEEPEAEVVAVAAIEDPMIVEQEENSENLKRQNEKKKRKFF